MEEQELMVGEKNNLKNSLRSQNVLLNSKPELKLGLINAVKSGDVDRLIFEKANQITGDCKS